MTNTAYDVLVVGGGPAGLAVAIGAARAGLDVAICERRPGIIDKACGEGLMPGALLALHRLGVDPPGHDIGGIIYRQGAAAAHARFRHDLGRGVRRIDLHSALRAAADELGIAVLEQNVSEVVQHADHVVANGLRARYLVAADGLHSPVRAAVGLTHAASSLRPSAPRWGQRQHFATAPTCDSVEVIWAEHSEAYVTPVGPNLIGVAVLSSHRGGFGEQLAEFPELSARLDGAAPASSIRGAGPLRQRVTAHVAGRVLLVGDAAGYIDALTGEGLAVAFASAEVLVDCLARDRPEEYEREWARVSRRSRIITSGLLWARERPFTSRRIVPLAARAPALFSIAVGQLAR